MTADPMHRLDRLERFLAQDPRNPALRAEAFELALRCGAWDRAEVHLCHGEALAQDRLAWALRRVHWLLARHAFDEARPQLLALKALPDAPPALQRTVAHDLAYVALRLRDVDAGLDELAPWLDRTPGDPALQALWLRLQHRGQRLDAALAWARERAGAGTLAPAAAGVASLAALDAGDHDAALAWSEQALAHDGTQMEALVARASLALAQRDAATARRLLDVALQCNGEDGRAWSALGFTDLLEQRLDAARGDFERALRHMPDHVGTWHGLGWTALLQHDHAGARWAFESALALDRNFAESHGALAVTLARQGDRAAAREAASRACRLDADNLSARYALALLDGHLTDAASVQRLATRLLEGRSGSMGKRPSG